MSDIDYLKNIQVLANLNVGNVTNEFTVNLSGGPTYDLCIIRQINLVNASAATKPYSLWSDLSHSYVASIVSNNGLATVVPKTQIKLSNPLSGLYTFKFMEIGVGSYVATADVIDLILDLEFIKYKK